MLNKAEKFELLRMIRFWFKIGPIPTEVNLSTREILPSSKMWTTWKCHFCFFLFGINGLYKLIGLVYWLKVGIPIHQAAVHAMLAVLPLMYCYWYYFLYVKYPRLFGMYVKMTLSGNEDGYEAAVEGQKVRSWSRRLKECTLQDLFAMSVSYMAPPCVLAIILTLITNPSMKCLLYAALPSEHQTWITFGLLLLEELRLVVVVCATVFPVLIVQVMSFDLVRNKLQLLIDSIQRATLLQRPTHIYKSLRHVQLYVGITNLINRHLIFTFKLSNIGVCIGTGYAAIAHFRAYPVFGVMYYFVFFTTILLYIFCFDKAFQIPDLFHEVTQRAMPASHGGNAAASKIFKRQMRSFPRVGIKVGGFHLMERESTMNFIDFVFNNIVSLLVAYG